MHGISALPVLLGVLVAGVAIPHAATATSESSGETANTLFVYARSIELVVGTGGSAEAQITVAIEGPVAATLSVKFVDLAVGEDFAKLVLPLGSTDYSVDGLVSVAPFDERYEPDGTRQVRTITIVVTEGADATLAYGGVQVLLTPDTAGQAGVVSSEASIVSSIGVSAEGYSTTIPEADRPVVTGSNLTVRPLVRSTFIDELIPDLPGVINYGPAVASVDIANTGGLPAFSTVEWRYRVDGVQVAELGSLPRLVLAGQKLTDTSISQNSVAGRELPLNALPMFGAATVQATVLSSLGGVELGSYPLALDIIVFPWKESLVTLILATLALVVITRWRKRSRLHGD